MVQRSTPLASVHRAYSAGGSRAMIDTIDDNKLMQEGNNCQGMRGESWGSMEAPQNYGFTSVVGDAAKGAAGMIKNCAEGFVSFMGGNRSFPVMGVMDDRRHRLMNLAQDAAKGATAMFGQKEWGQQLLNTDTGMYMTGNMDNMIRHALVQNQNGQKQQQNQAGQTVNPAGAIKLPNGKVVIRSKSGVEFDVELLDPEIAARAGNGGGGSSGGGNGSGSSGGGQSTGQKTLHKEDSTVWHQMDKNETTTRNGNGYTSARDSDSSIYMAGDRKKSAQATSDHTHIKNGSSIYTANGCFSEMPIIVRKDGFCKT
jgi:phage gp45-like